MYTKAALITDIHFGARGSSQYFLDRYKLFFENIFFPTLIKEEVKVILCLGDTWEDRKSINVNALSETRKMFFDKLEEYGIEFIAILGNHDVFYKNRNDINSMGIIESSYPNVRIIPEYDEILIGDKTFGMMSWVNNDNLASNLEIIKNTSTADYLLGHYEISGFEMTKGHLNEKGFSHDIFSKYEMVLSGHFHIKNKIGNIYYIGNPFQTNWDDFGADRGFHIFDSFTNKFNFFRNTYDTYNVLEYSDEIDIEEFDYSQYNSQIVKVLIHTIADLNQKNYQSFLEKLSSVTHEYSIIETGYTFVDSAEIVSLKSNSETIAEYVSSLNLENDLQKDVLELMHELHAEALSNRVSE